MAHYDDNRPNELEGYKPLVTDEFDLTDKYSIDIHGNVYSHRVNAIVKPSGSSVKLYLTNGRIIGRGVKKLVKAVFEPQTVKDKMEIKAKDNLKNIGKPNQVKETDLIQDSYIRGKL